MKRVALLAGAVLGLGACGQESAPLAPAYQPIPGAAAPPAALVDMWANMAAMPTARGALAAVAASSRLYAIGGFSSTPAGERVLPTVEVYNPATNSWSPAQAVDSISCHRPAKANAAARLCHHAARGFGCSRQREKCSIASSARPSCKAIAPRH